MSAQPQHPWTGPDLLDELAAAEARAHARTTDPGTSHAAAASVKVRESQVKTLALLRALGPVNDEQLVAAAPAHGVLMSPSGLRSRRSELVALGLVEDTGRRTPLASGRLGVVWQATP